MPEYLSSLAGGCKLSQTSKKTERIKSLIKAEEGCRKYLEKKECWVNFMLSNQEH